ncbi:MAG: beta-lactamase family protein [Candidatus Moduliflexus flocculans]|nr:beta-lactamase family protein [Candidatus Moduliflexus flocculans]
MKRSSLRPFLLVFAFVAVLASCQSCGTSAPPDDTDVTAEESFERVVTALMSKWNIPGGAVALARNGVPVMSASYGLADKAASAAVTGDSLFRIASLSKPVTAAAILKLREAGLLDLGARVFDILDDVVPPEGATPDPRLASVTVLDLLRHSEGWDRGVSFDPDVPVPGDRRGPRRRAARGRRGRRPLHEGTAARLRPGDEIRLLEFRLLPARTDRRKGRRAALCGLRPVLDPRPGRGDRDAPGPVARGGPGRRRGRLLRLRRGPAGRKRLSDRAGDGPLALRRFRDRAHGRPRRLAGFGPGPAEVRPRGRRPGRDDRRPPAGLDRPHGRAAAARGIRWRRGLLRARLAGAADRRGRQLVAYRFAPGHLDDPGPDGQQPELGRPVQFPAGRVRQLLQRARQRAVAGRQRRHGVGLGRAGPCRHTPSRPSSSTSAGPAGTSNG